MKLVPTLILAAGIATLGACGGGAETNVAANNTADDLYNIESDSLGNDVLLGNETLLGNEVDANLAAPADANAVDEAVPADNAANGL